MRLQETLRPQSVSITHETPENKEPKPFQIAHTDETPNYEKTCIIRLNTSGLWITHDD